MTPFGSRFWTLPPLLVALLLSACVPQGASSPPSPSGSVAAVSSPAFPARLTDDTGTTVKLAAPPQRIVSLAPSNTEIVCALGACPRIVGVTDADDFPVEVKALPKVVVQARVDVEKVVAARPDLVLAAGNELTPSATIAQLRRLGLTVLTLYPKDLDGVEADIALIGRALGRADVAGALVASMRARIQVVAAKVAGATRPRTFYEVAVFQGNIYTAGQASFLASLINLAGGDPVTGDAKTTAIQLEDLVARDPQLILLGDASYDPKLAGPAAALATVAARPGWATMSAVKDHRVVPMLDDVVITRPGPRIVDGLEALARAIHPELSFP